MLVGDCKERSGMRRSSGMSWSISSSGGRSEGLGVVVRVIVAVIERVAVGVGIIKVVYFAIVVVVDVRLGSVVCLRMWRWDQ